jgi:glyoxylase-like metal-dependent hydrolase (beta-lactamase superfamily II)
LQGKPVTRVIVTHFHPDHIGCAAWLAREWQAPVWMTQGEFLTAQAIAAQLPGFDVEAMVTQFARHGLDETHQEKFRARGNAYSKVAPELPREFCRILPDDAITIGGHAWRVIMGHGHSPEHASLYCEALGVVISGDMLLPRISTNVSVPAASPDADVLRWYLDSIAAYRTLPADTLVLPSHGRPFIGAHARVSELEQHHAERCAEILAACTTPQSACELLPLLFKRDLDTHQLMFAMGEAIAHLNFLHHDGRVLRSMTDDGIMRHITRAGSF